jgi:hypothetical protein
VDSKDSQAAVACGQVNGDVAIESSGAEQCGVEHVVPICGSEYDDSFALLETIHFAEDLIESLFAFVVSAANAGSAYATYGIDFVDEDDAGGGFASSFEEVANAGGSDADKHLDEFGAVN